MTRLNHHLNFSDPARQAPGFHHIPVALPGADLLTTRSFAARAGGDAFGMCADGFEICRLVNFADGRSEQ